MSEFDSSALNGMIEKLALLIADSIDDEKNTALIGIQTRGVHIADRVKNIIKQKKGFNLLTGKVDVTLFRDDINRRAVLPRIKETSIGFDIDGKKIILIDDVLFTGRTIKAAIEDVTSFGRPEFIRLAVIVDRGHREFPIQPDFCAEVIATAKHDSVRVRLTEVDGNDSIEIKK